MRQRFHINYNGEHIETYYPNIRVLVVWKIRIDRGLGSGKGGPACCSVTQGVKPKGLKFFFFYTYDTDFLTVTTATPVATGYQLAALCISEDKNEMDDEDPDPSIRACLSYGWFGTQLDVGPSTSLTY